MSFVEQADVFSVVENYLIDVVSDMTDKKIMN